jgi:hypothetical protein
MRREKVEHRGEGKMDASLDAKEVLAELQKSIDEGARNAQTLLLSTLLGCVYTWLAIAATTDAGLLTNTPTSKLPILDTSIPIAGFYWVAPFLLLLLHLYFHRPFPRERSLAHVSGRNQPTIGLQRARGW